MKRRKKVEREGWEYDDTVGAMYDTYISTVFCLAN